MGSVEFFCLQSNVANDVRFVNAKKGLIVIGVLGAIGLNLKFMLVSTSDLLLMIGTTKGSTCVRHATTFLGFCEKFRSKVKERALLLLYHL